MGIAPEGQADVRFAASQDVPPAGTYHLAAGGERITPRAAAAWPAGADKIGDGLGRDGGGADGIGDGGPGDGRGADGYGPDGLGSPLRTIRTPKLPGGVYALEVVGTDEAGNASTSNPAATAAICPTPRPPGAPEPTSYAGGTLTLTLSALSPDDDEA